MNTQQETNENTAQTPPTPEQSAGKELMRKYASFVWEVAKVVAISLAIIIPVRYYLMQPFYVKGASMEPNFYNYEYLVIDELTYRFNDPARGDVVVLHNPKDPDQFFIKRIIGLPGETIEVKNHHVLINGTTLDETPYLDETVETWGNQKVSLGEDDYYVMGDNRSESLDSRVFGAVSKDDFIGRTWIRAWPLNRIDHFSTIEYPQ
jgi:signal peptidase I